MTFEQKKQTVSEGFEEASEHFLYREHDLEAQSIYVVQAKEGRSLFPKKEVFTGFGEYDLNGLTWVWLKYGTFGVAHFFKEHADEENLYALQKGEEIEILMDIEEKWIPGSAGRQCIVAQISSGRGIIYQSPGFTMPGSVETPTPQSSVDREKEHLFP